VWHKGLFEQPSHLTHSGNILQSRLLSEYRSFEVTSEVGLVRVCCPLTPLHHQDVSSTALAAVESDVFVAGIRVKPADALLTAEEARGGGVAEWRVCLDFQTGNWV